MSKGFIAEGEKYIDEQTFIDAISIDCVVFGFNQGKIEVLVVKHAEGISKGKWGLPGGWITEKESIDDAAKRILRDLTGLDNIFLEQLQAFGEPERFPVSRVITIGYYALVKSEDYEIAAGFTASEVKWFAAEDIPELIYDHSNIFEFAKEKLKNRVKQEPIGFNLLPEKFTLLELMQLYEEILEVKMDKPNFRRKFLKMKLLVDVGEKQKDVSHRAAKLFKFDEDVYHKLTKKGFRFEF